MPHPDRYSDDRGEAVYHLMTGIELYKHLIETGHPIPTILVTAYPDDDARAGKAGIICYLRKPIEEERLIQCLRAALHL